MKYIQKQNSKKLFITSMLEKFFKSINKKLSAMEELSIKEGNQNWKKSKLAIILLTMKKLVMQILDLYSKKPKNKEDRKKYFSIIKQLMLKLKITTKLANHEMQIQKEKEKDILKAKQKAKILTPFELMLLNQMQNTR